MPNTLDEIKKALIDTVETRAKGFLSDNADAKAFLYERAERLARLTYEYTMAPDSDKAQIKENMEFALVATENQLTTIAVNAAAASRDLFKQILGVAMSTLIKVLPAIVAAV
jgi:hypothetical protein